MMHLSQTEKEALKKELAASLSNEPEVLKVVIFGSFITAVAPNDIDVAIFQNSNQSYLPLALKYRKKTRSIAKKIPLDILPLKPDARDCLMLNAIAQGEVIYEK